MFVRRSSQNNLRSVKFRTAFQAYYFKLRKQIPEHVEKLRGKGKNLRTAPLVSLESNQRGVKRRDCWVVSAPLSIVWILFKLSTCIVFMKLYVPFKQNLLEQ